MRIFPNCSKKELGGKEGERESEEKIVNEKGSVRQVDSS